MEEINGKYEQLKKEIIWRFKETDYTEEDKLTVCVHETIDKEVSFISIADVEKLSDELGVSKILSLEQDYLDEMGELSEKALKNPIDKLRLLLYRYFENRINEDKDIQVLEK